MLTLFVLSALNLKLTVFWLKKGLSHQGFCGDGHLRGAGGVTPRDEKPKGEIKM